MSTKTAAPVARRQPQSIETVIALIEARTPQFESLLGSPEAVERFKTVALHAVTSRPELLQCEAMSIVEAIREAATLDLEPTGVLGEAWLIPYKGYAKLRIGWQGHLKLIRRSGEVSAVDCQVVYEGDRFEIAYHLTPPFIHYPALSNRGGYRGAYAWGKLHDGTYIFEWLPIEDVDPIRKIAAADSLMWGQFPGEGMRKSAVRRLAKRLPKSAQLEQALKVEAETEEVPTAIPAPARQAAKALVASRFAPEDKAEPPEPQPEPVAPTEPELCAAAPAEDDPLGMTEACRKLAGHDGAHVSVEGSWPQ